MSHEATDNVLHTVSECDFRVGGTRYDVSNLEISLELNGIPRCMLGIAPPGGGDAGSVRTFDLEPLKEVFDDLSSKATKLEESSLKFTVKSLGSGAFEGSETEEVNLEGWLLADAGLEQVSTTGPFSLHCTIVHPAYKLLTKSGFFFDGTDTVDMKTRVGVGDPLEAVSNAIDAVVEANGDNPLHLGDDVGASGSLKTPEDICGDIRDNVEEMKKDLELIIWDPEFSNASENLPFDKIVSDKYAEARDYALMHCVVAGAAGKTMWDVLNDLRGTFGCDVVPTYGVETLSLCPSNPWKTPTFEIPDNYVSVLAFPGRDPQPIYGQVLHMGEGLEPAGGTITFEAGAAAGVSMPIVNAAYVPASSDKSIGALCVREAPPAWYGDFVRFAAEYDGNQDSVTTTKGDTAWDAEPDKPPQAGGEIDSKVLDEVLTCNLANDFMLMYRSQVRVSLQCAFMPMDFDHNLVFPGMNAKFTVGAGSRTLFSGEIMSMSHVIDFARSMAYTNIVMQNCIGDGKDEVLGDSPVCPMYQASR